MIRPIVFLDTAAFTAMWTVKYHERAQDGLLKLRDIGDDGEAKDLPILKEWKSARALLARFKGAAASLMPGQPIHLGKAWLELLPGLHGTPWDREDDDYAQAHIRTRTCLIPAPDCYTHSGSERLVLGVGIVNVIEHRLMCSEVNLSTFPRLHLLVDVRRPEADEEG